MDCVADAASRHANANHTNKLAILRPGPTPTNSPATFYACSDASNVLDGSNNRKENFILRWALIFALMAVVAGLLGFSGIAAGAAGVSKFLLVVLLILALLVVAGLVFGFRAFRKT